MKIYSTLSRQKEEFQPQGDEVTIYSCGVTPYAESHLGHAMNAVIFDTVRRYLIFRGYKVKFVQNITDVEDKIIDRANKLGIPPRELAEKFAEWNSARHAAVTVIAENSKLPEFKYGPLNIELAARADLPCCRPFAASRSRAVRAR